jgi:cell wall-associated NlpC family hydrolase
MQHYCSNDARTSRLIGRLLRAAVVGAVLVAGAVAAGAQVAPGQSIAIARVAGAPRVQGQASPAKPFSALSGGAQRLRDSVVAMARGQVGRRYVLGGQSPETGFDCSGLVRYLMAALNVQLPRTAHQQSARGREVARDTTQLRPGDLITFGSRKRISHIGIYVGEGRYVHASSVAGRVIESPLARRKVARAKPWAGARRVLADADTTR